MDLYAGLSGAELPVEIFDLGANVRLTKTYAHLMAPFMMAFVPAEPGKPHPAPWRAAEGGLGFDIVVQLHVPNDLEFANFDSFNTVWWIVALLRFRAAHSVIVPVISNQPFARAKETDDGIHFWPIEIEPNRLNLAIKPSILLEPDLAWIRDHWRAAGELMQNKEFNLLFQSFDQSLFVKNPALALLMLWGALESEFSPARTEIRFRVSANIAAYLEPAGKSRRELQKKVAKLYDARSVVAHSGSSAPEGSLNETYDLVRRLIHKIIEVNHVPTADEIEGRLFGTDE
jgi:hypothetical protein